MNTQIPPDLQPFVDSMIAQRRFLNEGDVVAEGLRLLRAHEVLRDEVRVGFDQLDAGRKRDGEAVFAEAEERIRSLEKGSGE